MDETFLALQRGLAGEYSLEREIGRGGMGIVYLAREVQLDRLVAIKVLPASLAADDQVKGRFAREARTAAALSHPNIVPIHRVGEAEGLPYFVMTYVRGETLGERLRRRGPLTPGALSRVMHDVSLALGYAHGRGVVHRDVKPDNILLEEESGRALVTDFGIARMRTDDDTESALLGTVQFMSPEQARGEGLDGRSDIYSLGVVAFLAASGKLPHDSRSVEGTLARIATQPAPKVTSVATGLPGGTARVIDRALSLNRDDRFRSAEELAAALDASSRPVRAAIPEVIRDWTSRPTPLLQVYTFWSAGWLIASANEFVESLVRNDFRGLNAKANAIVGLVMATLPLIPIVVFQLRKTHRALAAGYTLGDLRDALRSWVEARRRELGEVTESNWAPFLRGVVYGTVILVPAAFIALDTVMGTRPVPRAGVGAVLTGMLAGIAALVTLSALGMSYVAPSVEARFTGRLRSKLWNSRLGGWLAKWLTPAKRGVPETQFRPTELALRTAVDDLYAALPEPYRALIGGLPPVALRLSEHVSELRVEVEHLELIRANATGDEVAFADERLGASRKDLGRAVGALERMRLELLRLHGGADDVRAVTTSLDVARAMVEDIVRLRDAEGAVDPSRRLSAIDLQAPSPA